MKSNIMGMAMSVVLEAIAQELRHPGTFGPMEREMMVTVVERIAQVNRHVVSSELMSEAVTDKPDART